MRGVKFACQLLCACPALWALGLAAAGALGPNPPERLLHITGKAAVWLLLAALAVTPLRRLSVALAQRVQARLGKRLADWNWLVRLRRTLGVASFGYALLHALAWALLDAGGNWQAWAEDIAERPFAALGLATLLLMAPLAATSNNASVRRLGGAWKKLHLLAWPAGLLAVAHVALQARLAADLPLPEMAAMALLLAGRVRAWFAGDRAAAAEVRRGGVKLSGTGPGAAPPARPRPANSR